MTQYSCLRTLNPKTHVLNLKCKALPQPHKPKPDLEAQLTTVSTVDTKNPA